MYGLLAASFGWTFEHIRENVTVDDYNRAVDYLNRHPPIDRMVAAYLGYEGPEPLNWKTESFESLVSRWQSVGGGIS